MDGGASRREGLSCGLWLRLPQHSGKARLADIVDPGGNQIDTVARSQTDCRSCGRIEQVYRFWRTTRAIVSNWHVRTYFANFDRHV